MDEAALGDLFIYSFQGVFYPYFPNFTWIREFVNFHSFIYPNKKELMGARKMRHSWILSDIPQEKAGIRVVQPDSI